MRNLKSSFGVFGALVPILYCGGLLYYFLDLSGSVQEAKADGLGPTLLGLAAVGLLFSVPFIIKVVRMLAKTRSPGPGGPDAPADGEREFDADAAVARYMARKAAEEAAAPSPTTPATRPTYSGGASDKPASFGRRR